MFQHQESPPPRKGRVFLDKSRKKPSFSGFFQGVKNPGEVCLSAAHKSLFPVLQYGAPTLAWIQSRGHHSNGSRLWGEQAGHSSLQLCLSSSPWFYSKSLPVFIAHFLNYISGPTSAINALPTLIFSWKKNIFIEECREKKIREREIKQSAWTTIHPNPPFS